MTAAEFKVMFDLRSIPHRNAHYCVLCGDEAKVADGLVAQGLVVAGEGLEKGERAYRLNKPGREALLEEWVDRGSPSRKEVEAMS